MWTPASVSQSPVCSITLGRQWLCAGAGGARRRPHQNDPAGQRPGRRHRLWPANDCEQLVCGLILPSSGLRVGDTEIGGQLVKIAKIGLRATTVQADQADMIVPNTELITNRDELDPDESAGTEHYSGGRGVWVGHCARDADAGKSARWPTPECCKPEPQVLFRRFGTVRST